MVSPVAVTTGEPAGIGPEVSVKAAFAADFPVTLIGDERFLRETAEKAGLPSAFPANVRFHNIPLAAPVVPGRLDVRNAPYVVETLKCACDGALAGTFSAVTTGPVQKSIISDSGLEFTGHTEFFAGRSRVKRVVMMLTSSEKADALRVALATTRLPLAKVPAAITGELLDDVIGILVRDLRERFGISSPKIAVTGLNPHAGESGHMGREEIDVISPAIGRAQQKGSSVTGPWPADTIFVREHARHYDAILCMYHDQGLPVLKREGFGHGINVTLGLPWIRTSVDHGTALDIAGKNIADTGSMTAALDLARQMVRHATGDYSF